MRRPLYHKIEKTFSLNSKKIELRHNVNFILNLSAQKFSRSYFLIILAPLK